MLRTAGELAHVFTIGETHFNGLQWSVATTSPPTTRFTPVRLLGTCIPVPSAHLNITCFSHDTEVGLSCIPRTRYDTVRVRSSVMR